ncbi:MAG: hypothetical protein ABI145_14760 [Steroidobacteraceae bacterium]
MIATRIPPPVYALATATLIWLFDHDFPDPRLIPAPWSRLGWLIIALGLGIDAYAVLAFVRNHTTINPMSRTPQTNGWLSV